MKYFKYDLFLNDDEKEWAKNDAEYSRVFDKIKASLPESFLEIYLAEQGFHDRKINNIAFKDKNLKIEIVSQIKCFIEVEYKGVTKFSFNTEAFNSSIIQNVNWGYDEFEKVGDKGFLHSILTLNGFELQIHFNEISAVYRK